MKITAQLDYSTILRNEGRPVHLAVNLHADAAATQEHRRPIALCAVLDRSGSMGGDPLENAKMACETVIRNLRPEDEFALVTFDDSAQVVIPLQKISDKQKAASIVRQIGPEGSTNLAAGWMLGRDEFSRSNSGTTRRILLLSDGQTNRGIQDPESVQRIVSDGLERTQIRTSTLGFGEGYDEKLLESLATASGGNFYDANAPEKLPAIFDAELDGLQKIAVQNVRLRVAKLTFCENWGVFASYPSVPLPDGRVEIFLGDLTSDESATVVFHLDVLPLPIFPDGSPATNLDGEELLGLEILWDDLTGQEIKSCIHQQTIRVLGTQNPTDIKLNEDVIPSIATQCAGQAVASAVKSSTDGQTTQAIADLKAALAKLKALGNETKAADGIRAVESLIAQIETSGRLDARTTKSAQYTSSHMTKMKTHATWTLDEAPPSYSKTTIPATVSKSFIEASMRKKSPSSPPPAS
jgi:Ca-activated chloride channel family protein